jgi:RHS repeat-associated protein
MGGNYLQGLAASTLLRGRMGTQKHDGSRCVLPGGETAVYNASGLNFIRHMDWLGSSRLATTWAHGVYSKEAYAPFGETYNEAGTPDRSFTGQDQDTVPGVDDYLFRKYDSAAGRWLSPDPKGWGAVHPGSPQTLNRYAYVANEPAQYIDPDGLDYPCNTNDCNYGPSPYWVPDASYWGPPPTPAVNPTDEAGSIAATENFLAMLDAQKRAKALGGYVIDNALYYYLPGTFISNRNPNWDPNDPNSTPTILEEQVTPKQR